MPQVQCNHCGRELWKRQYDFSRYKQFYCDRSCKVDYERALQPQVLCDACGKAIVLNKGRKRRTKTGLHFCDNRCKNPYIARTMRWADNPISHQTRRPKLIEAAKHRCQNCGRRELAIMLDVHHDDGDHGNNCWTNLRCLCVRCHVGYHRGAVKLQDLPALLSELEAVA